MKKKPAFYLLGLAAAGAGAAGGMAAVGNRLYAKAMTPQTREPDYQDPNEPQREGRAWARKAEGFRSATIQAIDGLILWAAVVPADTQTHRWAICVHGYHDTH